MTELAALEKLYVLKVLHLDSNQLTELPEAVCWLAALEQLYVTGNRLSALPEAVCWLAALEVLHAAKHQFLIPVRSPQGAAVVIGHIS